MTEIEAVTYLTATSNAANGDQKKDSSVANLHVVKDEAVMFPFPDPKVKHRVIVDSELEGKEVFVIGDVHGCLDELIDLLEKCQLLKGDRVTDNVMVILCGDLVTKGPMSAEALKFIKRAGILAVRGNQDDKSLRRYFQHKQGEDYAEKNLWINKLTPDDITFISELPYTISIPKANAVIVHAGLLPGVPLEKQNRLVLTYMRSLRPDSGNLGTGFPSPVACDGQYRWGHYWHGPQHVYFGHDARNGLQQLEFATGLDTGCVYGLKLTGKFIHGPRTGEFVSVDARNQYYCPKRRDKRIR